MPDGRKDNGGPRPGAGRPPKIVEDAQHSVLLDLFDWQAERDIVLNMIANAKRKGLPAAPSAISAATWLWDRKYGKVKDQIEHSGGIDIKGYTHVSPDDWDEPTTDP
jgi:hypothetical protein